MADDEKAQDDAQDKGQQADPPAAAQNTDTDSPTIPKARFDEVLAKAKEAERKLAEHEARQRAEAEKQAKEQGKFAELADKYLAEKKEADGKLEVMEPELNTLREFVENLIASDVKGWDKEVAALVPETTDIASRLSAYQRAKPLALKLQGAESGAQRGNGSSGYKPTSQTTTEKNERDRQGLLRTGIYNRF